MNLKTENYLNIVLYKYFNSQNGGYGHVKNKKIERNVRYEGFH